MRNPGATVSVYGITPHSESEWPSTNVLNYFSTTFGGKG
jgi:hypothetical protein